MKSLVGAPCVSAQFSRKGLTLIELLVAIAIIAAIISVIFPAVQFARSSARNMECKNKLRQLSLAAVEFHDARSLFPPGVGKRTVDGEYQSVFVGLHLLPYLEQDLVAQQLHDKLREQPNIFLPIPHSGFATSVAVFACPDDGRVPGPQATYQNYVVGLTSYLGCNGTDHTTLDGVFYSGSRTRLCDITDGTTNTILFGERPPTSDYWYGWWYGGLGINGTGSPDGLLGSSEYCIGPLRYMQDCGNVPSSFSKGSLDRPCSVLHYWSFHTGGANFSFADGSVRFISYDGSSVVRVMATRARGEIASLK